MKDAPEELSPQTHLSEKSAAVSRSLLTIFLVCLIVAVVVGVAQQNHENDRIKAVKVAMDKAAASAAAIAWIPSGYTAFDANPDIARDPSANPACQSNSDLSGKYCWTYEIATKTDCSKVIATLYLTNSGTTVVTVTGEVDNVLASTPTFLEIDSRSSNDNFVNSNTKGLIKSIECK